MSKIQRGQRERYDFGNKIKAAAREAGWSGSSLESFRIKLRIDQSTFTHILSATQPACTAPALIWFNPETFLYYRSHDVGSGNFEFREYGIEYVYIMPYPEYGQPGSGSGSSTPIPSDITNTAVYPYDGAGSAYPERTLYTAVVIQDESAQPTNSNEDRAVTGILGVIIEILASPDVKVHLSGPLTIPGSVFLYGKVWLNDEGTLTSVFNADPALNRIPVGFSDGGDNLRFEPSDRALGPARS